MTEQAKDEMSPMQISVPEDLCEKVKGFCGSTGQTASLVVQQALAEFLKGPQRKNAVYLSTPVSALMKGLYEQNTTIADIKKHGNFGLGTFNDLDGEMVMLDGTVYQLRADGGTSLVGDPVQTPFACVTFFNPTTVEDIEETLDYASFKNLLYRLIPSMNVLYAIRVDGSFETVRVWSVPRQENHRPIQEVTPETFEYRDVNGTVVGFYTPDFIRSLSTAGYHLHFLTADRKHGGHLQQCRMKRGRIALQFVNKLELNLPITVDYLTATLT